VIDPVDARVLYAAGGHNAFFKSTDGGVTWVNQNNGLPRIDSVVVALDPSARQILYLGTSSGVYKSIDQGASWFVSGTELATKYVQSMIIDSTNPSHLLVGTAEDGIYRSADSGKTWQHAALHGVSVADLLELNGTVARFVAGTRGLGVFVSQDGTEWKQREENLPFPVVNTIVIDPADSKNVYIASRDGVYRSVNFGLEWNSSGLMVLYPEFDSSDTQGLAIDSTRPSVMYASVTGARRGIYKTVDQGTLWNRAHDPLGAINALTLSGAAPDVIFAGGYLLFWKSSNGGQTWQRLTHPGNVNILVSHPTIPEIIYASVSLPAGALLLRSSNAGVSWSSVIINARGLVKSIGSIVIHPQSPNAVYVGTDEGVYTSTDGGFGWRVLEVQKGAAVKAVGIDTARTDVLFAATQSAVFRSVAGAGFVQVGSDLAASRVEVLSLAYNSPARLLYAGTTEGVFAINVAVDGGSLRSRRRP